jgi:hypothetical protein
VIGFSRQLLAIEATGGIMKGLEGGVAKLSLNLSL